MWVSMRVAHQPVCTAGYQRVGGPCLPQSRSFRQAGLSGPGSDVVVKVVGVRVFVRGVCSRWTPSLGRSFARVVSIQTSQVVPAGFGYLRWVVIV